MTVTMAAEYIRCRLIKLPPMSEKEEQEKWTDSGVLFSVIKQQTLLCKYSDTAATTPVLVKHWTQKKQFDCKLPVSLSKSLWNGF